MRCGSRKIDRNLLAIIQQMYKSGRWKEPNGKGGRKHLKLFLVNSDQQVSVPGSSSDHRMMQNFIHTVRNAEKAAGYTDYSI